MSSETTSNAVERAFSILETVAESANGLSNSDISRRLKVPKSSASYILRVMEKRGYLIRGEGGKYRLGWKIMNLSHGQTAHLDVRQVAKPILEKFVEKSRMSEAHLAVLDNGRAVYVEKVETQNSFIKMDIWVGHRLPIHTTAIGKILVAYLPETEVLKILDLRGMEKKTRRSITDKKKFLIELEKTRKFGFALDNEENSLAGKPKFCNIMPQARTLVRANCTLTSCVFLHYHYVTKYMLTCLVSKVVEMDKK